MNDPAEKYKDKLSPNHKLAMDTIASCSLMLNYFRPHFEEIIKSESSMHSVGAILDPTMYRDMIYSKTFAQQMRLVRAALAFLKEIDEVKNNLNNLPPT